MNRQHIPTLAQAGNMIGNIKLNVINRETIGVAGVRIGVPGQRCRGGRIRTGHQLAVQEG